jgi:hypothetical protein
VVDIRGEQIDQPATAHGTGFLSPGNGPQKNDLGWPQLQEAIEDERRGVGMTA